MMCVWLQDFAAAGYTWTVELCNKDSDGDGHSNGAELGDPDCKVRPPGLDDCNLHFRQISASQA
jgi:hypothetical protein